MKNHENFKQIYDQVHASEGLLGKVMDLQMEKKEFKTRNLVKAVVCALALGIGLFGAGNGICYAATGESLVTKMKVVINGEETLQDVEWRQQGDAYQGEVVIPSEDGSSVTVLTVSEDAPENFDVDMEIQKDGTEEVVIMEIDEAKGTHSVTIKKEDIDATE